MSNLRLKRAVGQTRTPEIILQHGEELLNLGVDSRHARGRRGRHGVVHLERRLLQIFDGVDLRAVGGKGQCVCQNRTTHGKG